MGTTVEELKKLYTKLGGKDKQVATFNQPGEVLNAINEIDLPTDYELPKVTTADAGKVLTVSDAGKWDAEEAGGGLPDVTAEDEGKVLTVNSEGEWDAETPTKELPAVTSEDNGNVLTVVDGAWAKAAANDELYTLEITEDSSNRLYLPNGMTGADLQNIAKNKCVEIIDYNRVDVYRHYIVTYNGPDAIVLSCIYPYGQTARFSYIKFTPTATYSTITNKDITLS